MTDAFHLLHLISRLNNNSLTGSCPETLSNIEGLTLVYVFLHHLRGQVYSFYGENTHY